MYKIEKKIEHNKWQKLHDRLTDLKTTFNIFSECVNKYSNTDVRVINEKTNNTALYYNSKTNLIQ